MKVKQIDRHLKLAGVAVLALAFLTLSFLLIKQILYPAMEEKKVALYSYTNKATVNYEVLLKPNDLFGEIKMAEDQVYLTNLVNNITASFTYQFQGDAQADIKGNYEILMLLEGYTSESEKYTTIWQKRFTLVPRTNFSDKNSNFTLKRTVSLNIAQYNDFLRLLKEQTKVDTGVSASAVMNVNLDAVTANGPIQDTISSSLVFPLNTNFFKITKKQIEGRPGVIQEVKEAPSAANGKMLIFYGLGLGLLLLALLGLIFLTSGSTQDPYVKNLKRIFKKHGSRLVAFDTEISVTGETYPVKSFEDLVRFSDEIGKPVIYRYSANLRDISRFYVLDEKYTYYFELNKLAFPRQKTTRNQIRAGLKME